LLYIALGGRCCRCERLVSGQLLASLLPRIAGQLMYFNYEHPGVLPTVEGTIMWHVSCAAGIQPADEGLALVVAATSDGQFLNFGIDHSSGQAKHLATCKSGQSCITALGSEVDSCRGAAKSALLVGNGGGLPLACLCPGARFSLREVEQAVHGGAGRGFVPLVPTNPSPRFVHELVWVATGVR